MVKNPPTVCLDPSKPIAKQYEWVDDVTQSITVPDSSPGLETMVMNSRAAELHVMKSDLYSYPDMEDEEAHDQPDYSKIAAMDPVAQEALADELEARGLAIKADLEAKAAAEKAVREKEKGGSNEPT